MGIRGLLTMIEKSSSFEIIDLVEEARKKNGGIEILVDFNAIIRFVMEIFSLKLAREYDNEYLHFPIGVYDTLVEAFSDFHNGFGDAGIRLVWIADGPKGVDEEASEQKASTWARRDLKDTDLMIEVLSACRVKSSTFDRNNSGPILLFETAFLALKNAGAEVIHLLQGQADDFIAFEFHRRKSFAILTNDTDYVIFPDCVVIFEQVLRHWYEKDGLNLPFLDFENPGKIFKRPSALECPLTFQRHILRMFEFTSHTQLIALSILKGCDSTSDYSKPLMYHLGITNHQDQHYSVVDVANYIKDKKITSENIEHLPEIREFMKNFPQYGDSIKFYKELYCLKRIEDKMNKSAVIYDPSTNDDSLTSFLAKKLAAGEISNKIYSTHFGIIHDSVCPEKPSRHCPPILTLLSEIRRRIYPYLLKEGKDEVVEWRSRKIDDVVLEWRRSRSTDNLVKVKVVHATLKTNMIKGKPDDESHGQEKYGIDLFEETICHLEKDGSLHYVKKYGIKKALMCYVLRYLYVLTKGKNLRVSDKEFRGLFVTVFYQFSLSEGVKFDTKMNQEDFLRMKICPSERCLIIASWFMNIYFTAKYLCGAAFNLTEEFPSPAEIMSGPVLYAFYENLMSVENGRTSHLEDTVDKIVKLEKDVMTLFEGEFALITE